MKIKNIKKIILDKPQVFYDITVENYHNFSITNSNVITHNSSLEQSIVGMSQNFVGSNNLNLLMPSGQFGTRIHGGTDYAASRYIFTYLNPTTKLIFKDVDNDVLNFLDDDGLIVEPDYYLPIIPMALVNGAEGIGTGWSTFIPQYSPKDLIKVLEAKLIEKKIPTIHPSYKGFKGKILKNENGYVTRGIFEVLNTSKIKISELPVGTWTEKYLLQLDKLIDKKIIKDYRNNSSEDAIDITIDITREALAGLGDEKIYELLKLESSLNTTNMFLFVDTKITKFDNIESIINVFFDKRLSIYDARKEYLLSELNKDCTKIGNIVRFITAVISGDLAINNRKKDVIIKDLEKMKFDKLEDSYSYLLNLPIYSLTKERIDEYKELKKKKESEFKTLKATSIKDLWLADLEELKQNL